MKSYMEEYKNYTPLDTDKLNPKKKSFKVSNKALIGFILFFALGVGTVGFLLTRETLQTRVPAQVGTLTDTPVPISGQPTATQVPAATVSAGLTITGTPAVLPTETETPMPTPTVEETSVPTPTLTSAPIGGASVYAPTATPTEIVLVQATATPGEAAAESTQPSQIPSAGIAKFSVIFAAISFVVIVIGFIL